MQYLFYGQKFILWTKMIMFKYTESSINVCQTEANKFHLDNLLKYTKSQHIKILHPVHGFYSVSNSMGCQT